MRTSEYIRRILKQRDDDGKWTQERIADFIGVSQSTVHRWRQGGEPDGYKREAIIKLHNRLVGNGKSSDKARMVPVIGFVQAGVWSESWEWDEENSYDIPVPIDETLSPYRLYAAEVRGPSMDKRYPEGTIVVFSNAIETGEDPVPGKRYIVEREREDGDRETTVKTLWQDDEGEAWLLPESNDPRHQEPIALTGDEMQTIRIIGRVWYAVTREG